MVLDPKFAADHVADAGQGPAVGVAANGQCALAQQCEEALPLPVLQPLGTPRDRFGLERRQTVAVALEVLGPLANRRSTDPDFAGNVGLRESAGSEELAGIQAALLALLATEGLWFPWHHPLFYLVKQL
jgi:hypothetical protein